MAIPSQKTRQNVKVPAGQTLSNIVIGFKFLDSRYIRVYKNSAAISGYSIAGNTVNFSPAIAGACTVSVVNEQPISRDYDITKAAEWSSDTVNLQLDYLQMQLQRVWDSMGLVLRPEDDKPYTPADMQNILDQSVLSKNIAVASAVAAKSSEQSSAIHDSNAKQSAIDAKQYRDQAEAIDLGYFRQDGQGAVNRLFTDKVREIVSVADFGAVGDGVTDDTEAIQAALNALPIELKFTKGKTYKTDVLQIKGNCIIDGNGAKLLGSGNGLFNCKVVLDHLEIFGFKNVTWSKQSGTIGKQFFWNGNNVAGSTSYGATVAYDITELRIHDNNIGAAKIECFGIHTESRIYRNRWQHDGSVAVAPAYLFIERGTIDDDAGPVWVEDNYLDVYPPGILDAAIFKITGGITNATIRGNYLKNNRTNSYAHLNVFTGANKMRLEGNSLINTQLHRKQVRGSLAAAPTKYAYDYISGNIFDFEDGFDNITAIYFIGALGTIANNQFKLRNSTTQGYAIQFDQSDVDIGFDTSGVVATIVAGNIFDLRGAFSTTVPIIVSRATIGSSGSRYLSGYGNILLGGSKFFQGGNQQYSVLFGNVWGDSGGATGTSINGGLKNIVMGNVADSSAPVILGNSEGNLANKSIPILSAGAQPDISNDTMFFVNSNVNINNFTGGYIGKTITLFLSAGGSVTTIAHGTSIKLNGAVNFVFDAYEDSLTLVLAASGRWVEVGRSKRNYYAPPTDGTWSRGAVVGNATPVGFVGWVCVESGNPGTWKTFGQISS